MLPKHKRKNVGKGILQLFGVANLEIIAKTAYSLNLGLLYMSFNFSSI